MNYADLQERVKRIKDEKLERTGVTTATEVNDLSAREGALVEIRCLTGLEIRKLRKEIHEREEEVWSIKGLIKEALE